MRKLIIAAAAFAGASGIACVSPVAAVTGDQSVTSTLDGASVPDGGDPNGEGLFSAVVNVNNGTICYELRTSNIGNETKAHIHEGAAGNPGVPLVDLEVEENKCRSVDSGTLQAIVDNPSNYYVDVLTATYNHGAIRGQLALN